MDAACFELPRQEELYMKQRYYSTVKTLAVKVKSILRRYGSVEKLTEEKRVNCFVRGE